MRLTRQPMVLVLASVGVSLLVTGLGCSQKPLSQWEHESVDNLPLRPEWQRYADENYRGVVMAQFRSPFGVRFPDDPKVIATRNRTRGTTEMLAAGNVDVPDASGQQYRRPYTILWEQSGGGWDVVDVRVSDEGQPVRPEPTTPQPARPATRPATVPAEGQ